MRPDPVILAYRDKAWTDAVRRMPWAAGAFLALVGAGTVLDYSRSTGREPHLIWFNLTCLAIGAWALRLALRGSDVLRRGAAIAVAGAGLALCAYGAAVGGSAEMLVVGLAILLAGGLLVYPWGAVGQGLASLGALVGYPVALLAGAVPALDPIYGIAGLGALILLTVRGASVLDRHRLNAYRAVADLEGREARLQGYFDLALVGMAGLSADRRWLEANDEVCRMLDYGRTEILRRAWDEFVHPDEIAAHRAWFEDEGARGGDLKLVTRLVARGGRTVPAKVALRAMCRADGSLDSYVALVEDLTERHRAEVELRAAKEQAEAANQSKSDFLATMSHEIRTPMNLIFGMTEMALDSEPTPEQHEYLVKTRAAAGTLQVLLNDVLDFSKIEAGKLEVRPRPFAIRSWLAGSLGPLEWQAREKGIAMVHRVAPDVPEVLHLDSDRLGQVLVNLVSNAIKFTDRGRVEVSVDVRASSDPATLELHFAVADTGVGIPESHQDRIFEAFSQAPAGGTGVRGGAGLGLAICVRLIGLMGGRIWVESREGEGSRFHFVVRPARAPEMPSVQRSASQAGANRSR